MSSLCCDICFEQFTGGGTSKPMIICANGHSVCQQCSKNMKLCPQCRSPCLERPIPNISLLKTLDNLVNLKVLVVGDSGVGKSSLMLRYTDDKFHHDLLPTVGLDFRVKVLEHNGFSVKLCIWDTAGQERFRNISSAYYRGAQGVVLVYDVTSAKTLVNLDTWLQELNQYESKEADMIKIVVGCKSDQIHRRQVSPEQGAEWAQNRGLIFLEASSKSLQGVDAVFTLLVDQILQNPQVWSTHASRDDHGTSLVLTHGHGPNHGHDSQGKCCLTN